MSALKLLTARRILLSSTITSVRYIRPLTVLLRPQQTALELHRSRIQTNASIRNMSSIGLDDKVKSLVEKSYPQAKDADSDPVKLSQALFPSAEVSTRALLGGCNTKY